MTWQNCAVCDGTDTKCASEMSTTDEKMVNFHESCESRQFRIRIIPHCAETGDFGEIETKPEAPRNPVDFWVNLTEVVAVCPYFQKFKELPYVEISTNCTVTWVSGPEEVAETSGECRHDYKSTLTAKHFHAFLESACPSLYGIRPVPVTMKSIVPVLDMLAHFHSEPLLTNCERVLMATNINQLDGSLLIRLLDRGLCVSLDHRILGRILCVCLMNTSKMADFSQELVGTVGAVFAQAFLANATKNFRHIKPLEQEMPLWPARHQMPPVTSSGSSSGEQLKSSPEEVPKKSRRNGKRKTSGCDHSEEAFECILCFDQRCGKCKGESAFCYKALDNFLYEVRLQLYPHTYRPHLDRDMLREDRINDYILRHQLQPLPL